MSLAIIQYGYEVKFGLHKMWGGLIRRYHEARVITLSSPYFSYSGLLETEKRDFRYFRVKVNPGDILDIYLSDENNYKNAAVYAEKDQYPDKYNNFSCYSGYSEDNICRIMIGEFASLTNTLNHNFSIYA